MKNSVKLVSLIVLFTLSGSAFAQSNPGSSALQSALSVTAAMDKVQAPAVPQPEIKLLTPGGVGLHDITRNWTSGGQVYSAYPAIYRKLPAAGNSGIIRIFRVLDSKGDERRLEVYYTGGKVYFATNCGRPGSVSAYFMKDFSVGANASAPRLDPFSLEELVSFISSRFLDEEGNVKPAFSGSLAATAPAN
ncbi:MAG: hypothetical protein HY550_04775 [Elusimicrobia bacterium]|nr:hypothetical protein [Elusimicrobiota bacterium]